jgi:hypothetical protein
MVHFTRSMVAASHLLYTPCSCLDYFHTNQGGFIMTRFAHMVVLTAFLAIGFGVAMTFASEPAPAEQKDKKDQKEKKDTTISSSP